MKADFLFGFDDVVQDVRAHVESVVSPKTGELEGSVFPSACRDLRRRKVSGRSVTQHMFVFSFTRLQLPSASSNTTNHMFLLFLLNLTRASPINSILTTNRCGVMYHPFNSNDVNTFESLVNSSFPVAATL